MLALTRQVVDFGIRSAATDEIARYASRSPPGMCADPISASLCSVGLHVHSTRPPIGGEQGDGRRSRCRGSESVKEGSRCPRKTAFLEGSAALVAKLDRAGWSRHGSDYVARGAPFRPILAHCERPSFIRSQASAKAHSPRCASLVEPVPRNAAEPSGNCARASARCARGTSMATRAGFGPRSPAAWRTSSG